MGCWSVLLITATIVDLVVSVSQGGISICAQSSYVLQDGLTIQYLHSPNSSEITNPNEACSVEIDTDPPNRIIQMNMISFDLGGQDPCSATQEHLSIVFRNSRGDVDTVRWCGQSYGPSLETKHSMQFIYFPGPAAERGGGFNFTLSVVSQFRCGLGSFRVGEEAMYIYSPGYPSPYTVNLYDCSWDVESRNGRSLLLDTLRFALEQNANCRQDYLEINREQHCNTERVQTTSRFDSFRLKFYSDHIETGDGFVLKITESPPDSGSCGKMTAGSAPILLQVPSLEPGLVNRINCWWLVDSGSNDSVVLLDTKQFDTTASCSDFEMKIYNGDSRLSPRILSKCAPVQMFQTIRSSSRHLYIDVDLYGFGYNKINVSFTVTSSLRDAAPRVLYADFAVSYIWLDLDSKQDLGLLVRGSNDNPRDYRTCIQLTVKRHPDSVEALNITNFFYAFSGWNLSFSELGSSCGRQSSEHILSYGNKIFIKFNPALTSDIRRVWLTYSLQRYCKPEIINLQSSNNSRKVLRSDFSHYTNEHIGWTSASYPNNNYCRWLIHPNTSSVFTQAKVIESELSGHDCNDNVTVYDYDLVASSGQSKELLQWCYNQKPVILSSKGHGLLVEFITDFRRTQRGFSLDYSSVSLVGECPSMASLNAVKETAQNLTSPNYPHDYPNNVDCRWRITTASGVIKVTVNHMAIYQSASHCTRGDFLIMYDGRDTSSRVLADLCGDIYDPTIYFSSSAYLLLHFHSDGQTTSPGFSLQFQSSEDVAHWQCNKEVYVTHNQDGVITSPFYPNPYPRDTDCYWLVLAPFTQIVMLEVIDVTLPSCQDSAVLLYDGQDDNSLLLARVCGTQHQNRYTSTQKAMYIRFRTNGYVSKGFKFRLRSWTYSGACQGQVSHMMAYSGKHTISSPQYPSNYPPNSDCKWLIESAYKNRTVRLDIVDAKLESTADCSFDSVTVYDGDSSRSPRLVKFCGERTGSFYSSGPYMLIHFQSDDSTQFRGFQMSYFASTTFPPTTKSPTSSGDDSSSVGPVVGGVMGGVVLLLVGITVFMCFLGRCPGRRPNSSSPPSRQTSRSERGSTVFVMSPVIVNQMAPPPYPGRSNQTYITEERPPAYPASGDVGHLPPPPSYTDIDAPPPYTETMMESNPPSSPVHSSSEMSAENGRGDVSGAEPALPTATNIRSGREGQRESSGHRQPPHGESSGKEYRRKREPGDGRHRHQRESPDSGRGRQTESSNGRHRRPMESSSNGHRQQMESVGSGQGRQMEPTNPAELDYQVLLSANMEADQTWSQQQQPQVPRALRRGSSQTASSQDLQTYMVDQGRTILRSDSDGMSGSYV